MSQLIKFDMMEHESRKHYSKEVIHCPQSHAIICLLLAACFPAAKFTKKRQGTISSAADRITISGQDASIGVTGFLSLCSGLSSWSNPNKSSFLLQVFHRLSLSLASALWSALRILFLRRPSLSLSLSVSFSVCGHGVSYCLCLNRLRRSDSIEAEQWAVHQGRHQWGPRSNAQQGWRSVEHLVCSLSLSLPILFCFDAIQQSDKLFVLWFFRVVEVLRVF